MKKNILLTQWCSIAIIVLIAVVIAQASYLQSDSAYLFPKLLSGILLLTALTEIVSKIVIKDKKKITLEIEKFGRLFPALIYIFTFIYCSDIWGFYVSSLLFLLVSISTYGAWFSYKDRPQPYTIVIKDSLFCIGFTILMYLLFKLLLKVQTPGVL